VAATHFRWLNVRRPPFDNLLAREAVNYAINRAALSSQDAFMLAGRPTCQLLPPDFPGYVPYCPYTVDPMVSGRWLAPDLSKARALVRQSGTTADRVIFLSIKSPPLLLAKEVIATLRSIGYRATAEAETPGEANGPQQQQLADRAEAGGLNYGEDYVASSDFFGPIVVAARPTWGRPQPTVGGSATRNSTPGPIRRSPSSPSSQVWPQRTGPRSTGSSRTMRLSSRSQICWSRTSWRGGGEPRVQPAVGPADGSAVGALRTVRRTALGTSRA
jgi:ABC-type transport system substrate-binding protein